MAKLFTVQDAGITVATLAGAKERFDNINKEVFGADIDTGLYTPQNQIAGINAQIWSEVGEYMQRAVVYGSDMNHAPGRFLDAFGSLFGVKRRIATHTRVECELTGIDGVIVPQGSLVSNSRGDQFVSQNAVEIKDGKATVNFVALDTGPVPAGVGEVNKIESVTDPRWKTVINKVSGFVGTNEESDAEYRQNLKHLTSLASLGTIGSLRSAFVAAGATKVLILENSTDAAKTVSGVLLPPRSLMSIVDGGLTTDLVRAYESYRPVGVSTHALASASKLWVPSDTGDISQGSFKFNGKNVGPFRLTTDSTLSDVFTRIFADGDSPKFLHSNNLPLVSYEWSPDIKGFEAIKGNVAEDSVLDGFYIKQVIASPSSNEIIVEFNKHLSGPTKSFNFEFTRSGEDAPVATTYTSHSTQGCFEIIRTNPALPSDLESIVLRNIKAKTNDFSTGTESEYFDFANIHGEIIDTPSASEAPTHPIACIQPIDRGVRLHAFALGTVSYWEYAAFTSGDYTLKNSDGTIKWITLNFPQNYQPVNLTGSFTNNHDGSRIHLRPCNAAGVAGPEISLTFRCENIPPVVSGNVVVDGKTIVIPFDRELLGDVQKTGINWWVVHAGSNRSVSKQIVYRNKVYLTLTSAVTSVYPVSIEYDASDAGAKGIRSFSNISCADFTISSSDLTNQTKIGLPSMPMNFMAAKYADERVRVIWDENYNGGQTIDATEYSVSYDGGNTWADWETGGSHVNQLHYTPNVVSQLPNKVRARASNPNAQTLQKLGFTGLNALAPITRPVNHRLKIVVTLSDNSELVRDALNEIKAVLVRRVSEYDMGETIWVNDLLAVAELVQGTRITDMTVTYDGTNVNDVEQPAYVNWVISENDITFA